MNIRSLHYFSGLILTVFIGLHLFNHFISLLGVETHIDVMEKLRLIYRNLIIESILLIAVFLQIISGIKLIFTYKNSRKSFYQKLQIWTGMYLAFFLIIHVGAVMAGRYILNLDTNFYFGVAGLNTFPFNLFFIPYYGFAIFSFFGHIASIHSKKMKKKLLGFTVEQQSKFILINGAIITIIIFYGLTNGFTGVVIPDEYQILLGR